MLIGFFFCRANVHKNMSTRECLLMTPVIPTKACLLMSSNFLRLARAISPNLLIFRILQWFWWWWIRQLVAWLVKERNYLTSETTGTNIYLFIFMHYHCTNCCCCTSLIIIAIYFFKAKSLIPKLPFLWCYELLRVQIKTLWGELKHMWITNFISS